MANSQWLQRHFRHSRSAIAVTQGDERTEAAVDTDFLLYDGECPVCSAYVAVASLRQLHLGLKVLNARAEPDLVAELRGRGYEINDGMVLCLDGVVHFGADATRVIALMARSSPSRWRRAGSALIGAAPWSRRLYPRLNRGRQALLRLLRRGRIG
jgi:predicted DCC family thiol-disulfide oxidoreductase YuxK